MEVLDVQDLMIDSRVQEVLTQTGLDFRIDTIPLTGIYNDREIKSGYKGLVNSKSGKVIYAAKPTYTVSQNETLVRLMLKGTESFGNLKIQKGGSLNGGRRTFLQLEIERDKLSTIRGDKVSRFITGLDSNNGSSAICFGLGNQTMSCSNMFFQMMKESEFKIYHNSHLERQLKLIPDIIFACLTKEIRQMEILHEMSETSIHKDLAHEMVKSLVGLDRTMTKIELAEMDIKTRKLNIMNSLYDNINKEIASKGENMWALFNGITSYTTHNKSVPKREFGRIESLFHGSVSSMNDDAFKFAMKKAELVW